MRSLVSIYFFLRFLLYLVPDDQIPPDVDFSIFVVIYTACSTLIALAQPYKRKYMNVADTLILVNLAIISLILSQLSGELSKTSTLFFYTSGCILTSLLLLGLIGVLGFKVIRKITQLPCYKRLRLCICQHGGCNNSDGQADDHIMLEICDGSDHELLESTGSIEDLEEHRSVYHSFT